jgi:cell fate (sporulation/competence/biofilm development) regulator YlbF (YheA/YmcA/DUF963 family)
MLSYVSLLRIGSEWERPLREAFSGWTVEDLAAKARDLGQGIAGTKEFLALREAEKAVQDDTQTRDLIEKINREMRKLQNMEALGMSIPPSAVESVEVLRKQLEARDTFAAMLQKRLEFEQFFQEILESIQEGLPKTAEQRIVVPPSIILPGQEGLK